MRRYDRELSLEIDRTVKRFNQKVKRLEKQERELELPEPITRTDIVTSTSRKSTIEKKLKQYQKFLERGAETEITTKSGVSMTKYEYEHLKQMQKSARASLTREINKLQNQNITVFGVKQAGTFESMGDPYYTELESKRKALSRSIDEMSKEEIGRRNELLNKIQQRKERQITFKSNYLEMLEKLAYLTGVDKRKVDYLNEKLKVLTPSQINELINRDKGIKAVMEYYMEIMRILRSKNKDMSSIVNDVEDLYDSLVNNIDEIIEADE